MYIIPAIRTTRALSACTLLPNNPLLAITLSEVLSVVCPFIKNSNQNIDIILFLYQNSGVLNILGNINFSVCF